MLTLELKSAANFYSTANLFLLTPEFYNSILVSMYDVIIVGGGPAGLSGALVLARCLRKILVCDTGLPRNRWTNHMNGFITRDGIAPSEFLKMAKLDLEKYGVESLSVKVESALYKGDYFEVYLEGGKRLTTKKMLIATGLKDKLPEIEGIEQYYGKSVHHCPYCDGYQWHNRALVAYGKGSSAKGLSLSLKTWSKQVTLCTDGFSLNKSTQDLLNRNEVVIKTAKVSKLYGDKGLLESISFSDGSTLQSDALFFVENTEQQSQLARGLNCIFTKKGVVKTDRFHKTNIKGLYVAGDADKDMQQVIVAAAEGAQAGININKELQEEEMK